ncbi:hypothetical protein Tco_1345389 [Tanacetum coccineum]
MYRIASTTTQTRTPQLPHASRNTNLSPSLKLRSNSHYYVSNHNLRAIQVKDKVVPNISQVKFTKKEVEDNHRISSTVHFGNDQFALILGYGDLIQGNVTIKRVYYVEGLNHNLYLFGWLICDADLENGVVERRNRTQVEASPMIAFQLLRFHYHFWAEAVAHRMLYSEQESINQYPLMENGIINIINDSKPSIKHLYIFGATCYITREGKIWDTNERKNGIHVSFDEIKEMMSDHNSSDLAPQRQMVSVENNTSGPIKPRLHAWTSVHHQIHLVSHQMILVIRVFMKENTEFTESQQPNEPSSSKLVPKVVPLSDKDKG